MQKEEALKIVMGGVVALLIGAFIFFIAFKPRDGVKVYFFMGDRLRAVFREMPKGEERLNFGIMELLKGPSDAEKKGEYFSEIPPGVTVISIVTKDRTAIINFNQKLAKYGGGSTRVQGLIAQIVYTATETRGIEKVRILVEGEGNLVLGAEGYVIDHPLGRWDVRL